MRTPPQTMAPRPPESARRSPALMKKRLDELWECGHIWRLPFTLKSAQGAGRNTHIAAGPEEVARTARKRRSIDGSKWDVRAPETVGIRVVRRYPGSRVSKTSMKPCPQLTYAR